MQLRFLLPTCLKAGQALADQAIEHLPEGVGKVWGYVVEKFQGKPAAEEAANDLASHPDDEDSQAAFRRQLKKLLEDPTVVSELSALLTKGKESMGINVQSGAVATGGGVAAGARRVSWSAGVSEEIS